MKNAKMWRGILLFWCLFIGLGAVGGAICMFVDPSGETTGMAGLLPGLRKLPFADTLFANLIFSGVSLLIVNGLTQLAAAWLLIRKRAWAARGGLVCGALLMLWITIQFCIFPLNVLSTLYFIFGALEAATALVLMRLEAGK